MAAFDKGYIEIYDYPRADTATITYTADGHQDVLQAGSQSKACSTKSGTWKTPWPTAARACASLYERCHGLMTAIRQQWGLTYPEEEGGAQ